MESRTLEGKQADAIAFVSSQKSNIYWTARKINPNISKHDLNDLVAEGYLIALELIATGSIEELKDAFWPKLHRSVWEGYDYLVEYVDALEDQESPILTAIAPDPLQKIIEEEEVVVAASSVLDFLSPTERRVFCLMLGLTARGYCLDRETSRILGISRFAVRTMLTRIFAKIESAVRHTTADGYLVLSRGRPKKHRAPPDPPCC